MLSRRSALLATLAAASATHAQTSPAWPSRPLRMIITWPPGQATDLIGRVLAQALTERLGQSVVPENRGGAGGMIMGRDLRGRRKHLVQRSARLNADSGQRILEPFPVCIRQKESAVEGPQLLGDGGAKDEPGVAHWKHQCLAGYQVTVEPREFDHRSGG